MDETPAVCSGLNFSDLSSSGPEKKESKVMLTVIEEYSCNVTKPTFNKLTIYVETPEQTISNIYYKYKKCERTLTFLISVS